MHATTVDPKRRHPVLDLAKWEREFPMPRPWHGFGCVNGPGDVAEMEQARRLAAEQGALGPSVPVDLFVWGNGYSMDYCPLTSLGGLPWREAGKPWPRDEFGAPLQFLGQICFADSMDLIPFKLPGDVALVFGRWHNGSLGVVEDSVLEWSPLEIVKPCQFTEGYESMLPFCYRGVIHRTVQYVEAPDEPFEKAGLKDPFRVGAMQGTMIGSHAGLPQGWPFAKGDGKSLVAVLSSFSHCGRWPMCDTPRTLRYVRDDGTEHDAISVRALSFHVGDGGCMWIYRDRTGEFRLDEAGG